MMGDICRISDPFHYRRNFNGRSAALRVNFLQFCRRIEDAQMVQMVGSRQNSRKTFFASLGMMLDRYVWTNWSLKRGRFSAFKNLKQ